MPVPLHTALCTLEEQALAMKIEGSRLTSLAESLRSVIEGHDGELGDQVELRAAFDALKAADDAQAVIAVGRMFERLNRYEGALAVYEELLEHLDDHQTTDPAVALAMFGRGRALGELGRPKDEVAIYSDLEARFTTSTSTTVRLALAKAAYNGGWVNSHVLEQPGEAVQAYSRLDRLTDATDHETRKVVSEGLVNLSFLLNSLERPRQAKAVTWKVTDLIGQDDHPDLRKQVALALLERGRALESLGQFDEASDVFDDLARRFCADEALTEVVADGMAEKCAAMLAVGRPAAALRACTELETRFGSNPACRVQVVTAKINKALALEALAKPARAIAACADLVAGSEDESDPWIKSVVATALILEGRVLSSDHRDGEAVPIFDRVIDNYRDVVGELELVGVLVYKANALRQLNRHEEAIAVDEDVVSRLSNNPHPDTRYWSAEALVRIALSHERLGDSKRSVEVSEHVIEKYGKDPHAHMQTVVSQARTVNGDARRQLRRSGRTVRGRRRARRG